MNVADLPKLPGWSEPEKVSKDEYRYGNDINNTHLIIKYFRDSITETCITEGIFWDVGTLFGKKWLFRDNRRFDLDFQLTSWGDLKVEEGDLAPTTHGLGEYIETDISTPEKMAVYLEMLVKEG